MAAVAERDVPDVADAEPVDERDARLDRSTIRDARRAESSTTEPFSAITIALGGHARVAREPRVRGEHPELAVHRHDRLRAERAPSIVRSSSALRVAGDVHGRDLLVEHLRAGLRAAG